MLFSATRVEVRIFMTAQARLDELLNTDPESLIDWEQTEFNRLSAPYHEELVIVGAGNLGRVTLAGLRKAGIEPLAFADNSHALQGSKVWGCNVLSPSEAVDLYKDRATFVIAVWGDVCRQKPLRSQLQWLGCKRIVSFTSLFCKHHDAFLPFYAFDLPHKVLPQAPKIREVFSLLADEPSRHEFVAQLRWRLKLEFDILPLPVEEEQYFCDSLFLPAESEVFVDCGAFDGDTLKAFLARNVDSFENYLAIEPDPGNCKKLESYVAMLPKTISSRVSVLNLATGAQRSRVRFDATGTVSSAVERGKRTPAFGWLGLDPTKSFSSTDNLGSLEIDCVPLDEIMRERPPTSIKMDIEGSEYDSLKGATRLIESHAPLLEICLYHQQDHLWGIPGLIHSLRPDYELFLRRHHEDNELVCYAVPPKRRARQTR
jgi:FkbM family methyltransferase